MSARASNIVGDGMPMTSMERRTRLLKSAIKWRRQLAAELSIRCCIIVFPVHSVCLKLLNCPIALAYMHIINQQTNNYLITLEVERYYYTLLYSDSRIMTACMEVNLNVIL
jgi:hypothetical protein